MYLGIDLGTSGVKLVLIDEQQQTVAQSSQGLVVSQPKPLWSEQNPEDWWQATCQAVLLLKQENPTAFAAIKAIGLSGQQHGATLLDGQGKVLRPAILWNDGRSVDECEHFAKTVPDYATLIGSRIMPGFTAPKILWVAKHEPAIFKRLAKVLLPKDYLRFRMTDEYATDASDASGTGWLDIANRCWSDNMLAATGLTQEHMPKIFEGSAVTGTLSKKVAGEWGLASSTKLIGGGGDNPAAAISINVIEEGTAFLSLGTSGVYFVASDVYKTNPFGGVHTFCHCLPKRWHHMTVHLSAASCLSWLAKTLQASESELLAEAELAPANHDNIIFLPYLSGERSPHNNPYARGVFFGISNKTTRADMTRAVLEGVAFAFADGQDAMLQAGIHIKNVAVVGGGAQSIYWGKILASVLNRQLVYNKDREVGAAVGAARLAWLGIHQQDPATAFKTAPVEAIVEPDAKLVSYYQNKRKIFCDLYQRLESLFSTALLTHTQSNEETLHV